MALDQHWLATAALVTSSLVAVAANSLLLLVFCRRRGLRTVSNRFTINLLLANLLSSVLLIPLLIVDEEVSAQAAPESFEDVLLQVQNASAPEEIIFQEQKEAIVETASGKERVLLSDRLQMDIFANGSDSLETVREVREPVMSGVLCYAAQTVVGLVCTASILSVLLVGIDQYFAVLHSLRYHSYIDKFRSTAMILTAWCVSLLFGVLGAASQSESSLWHFCKNMGRGNPALNSVFAIAYFVCVILVPFFAICVIYVCIYTAARDNSERMRKTNKGNSHCNLDSYMQIPSQKAPSESLLNLKAEKEAKEDNMQSNSTLHKVQSAPNFSNLELSSLEESHATVKRTSSDRVGFINNLKHKISNASVFRYREESRAARISLLVIFMVMVCYTPYGLAVLLNSKVVGISTPHAFNFASLVLLVLSNIISPFLFAYRNRRIRRELLKLLGAAPVRSPSLRRSFVRPKAASLPIAPLPEPRERIEEEAEAPTQPFLAAPRAIPQVVITYKVESEKTEKPSILKRVCSGKNWQSYKKCTFIQVPESCWQTDSARGSFSSASTQISTED